MGYLCMERLSKSTNSKFTFMVLVTTGENLDAVTAVTDSFKMADVFAGDRTGGAVA